MKDRLIRALKILISALLMYLLLRKINIDEFRKVVSVTAWDGVAVVILAYLLSTVVNAVKWRALLPDTELRFLIGQCFRAQLYSVVLPGQLFGEASKMTVWSGRDESMADVAASVVFDKITGLVCQAVVGIIGLYFSVRAADIGGKWLLLVFLGFMCLLLFMSAERHVDAGIRRMIAATERISRTLQQKILRFYDAWSLFSARREMLLKSFLWGFINQFLAVFPVWYLSEKMGMNVGFQEYCWIILLMSVILLLPISFAGIGLRDSSLASFLSLFGVSVERSLIISMSILAGQCVAAMIGAVYMLVTHLKRNCKTPDSVK